MNAAARNNDDDEKTTIKPFALISLFVALIGIIITAVVQPLYSDSARVIDKTSITEKRLNDHMQDGHAYNCEKVERRLEQLEHYIYRNGKE